MKTRISAKYVIGYAAGDHQILPNACIVYEGEQIIYVGRDYPGSVDEDIDAGNAILSPGFIDLNALGDIDHALFDTWQGDDLRNGLTWSTDYLHNHGPVFTPAEAEFRREFAAAQLARNGITTLMAISAETYLQWCEDYDDMAYLAQAVDRLGLRAYLGPSYRAAAPYFDGQNTQLHWDEPAGQGGLAAAVRFAKDFHGAAQGRIRAMLAPARIETQTEELLVASRRWADTLACPLRLHAAQGLGEVALIKQATGRRPLPYLRDIGFLGEQTFIPHCWTVPGHSLMDPEETGDDLQILVDNGTNVIFCPLPSARLVGVMESFDRYRQRGIRVCLGTDSAPPSMLKVMETANVLMKRVDVSRTAASFADLYRAATLEPAAALGRTDIGRLDVGAQADYFVLDLGRAHTGPTFDPIRTMVMNADSRDITRVCVAGRPVIEAGQIVTVDTSDYAQKAQEFLDKYAAAFSRQDYLCRPTVDLLPASFPLG